MNYSTYEILFIYISLHYEDDDESVDGIIFFYSIIHTPKQFQHVLFCEFNRVLKAGGRICVVVKKGDAEGYVDELIGARAAA